MKTHSMREASAVGESAVAAVNHFLHSWPQTVAVHSVEADPAYQTHDVDLLWTVLEGHGRLRTISIEVKGDRYHKSGNFFLETVSNTRKNTPGCIIYSKAKWLFYYFVGNRELYCLPLAALQPWFYLHMDRFPLQETRTPTARGGTYTTQGRLVPIQIVLEEVAGIQKYVREGDRWQKKAVPPLEEKSS